MSPFPFVSLLTSSFSSFTFLCTTINYIGCSNEAASGDTSIGDLLRDPRAPWPFHVLQYIKQYSDSIDDRHFHAMCISDEVRKSCHGCTGRLWDTLVRAWIERWWYGEMEVWKAMRLARSETIGRQAVRVLDDLKFLDTTDAEGTSCEN